MGNLRIAQASALTETPARPDATDSNQPAQPYQGREALIRQRLLTHAHTHLQHALLLERLEMETHTRTLLALTHVALLQQKQEEAEALLSQVHAEARHYELTQIEKLASKLLEQVDEKF